MNLHQLEYIIAVDRYRHFQRAADSCFVTQATLSMMIRKLEDELDIKIFDRSKQPVVPTDIGAKVIVQAARIISEAARMKELVKEEKGEIRGELKVGIIPTLAPYLLPLFLKAFTERYPQVKLTINEYTTSAIISGLIAGQLDTAILATPLHHRDLKETPLFYEKYFLYVNNKESGFDKNYVLPKDINIDRLWLLEEGHCMRAQILNFCELKKQSELAHKLHYEAGSIETLKNLVDRNFGITIIPELATQSLTGPQMKRLRFFKPPTPVREISLVVHHQYVKDKLIDALRESILQFIPDDMKAAKKMNVLPL